MTALHLACDGAGVVLSAPMRRALATMTPDRRLTLDDAVRIAVDSGEFRSCTSRAGAARREISRLIGAGYIERVRDGRRVYYAAVDVGWGELDEARRAEAWIVVRRDHERVSSLTRLLAAWSEPVMDAATLCRLWNEVVLPHHRAAEIVGDASPAKWLNTAKVFRAYGVVEVDRGRGLCAIEANGSLAITAGSVTEIRLHGDDQ